MLVTKDRVLAHNPVGALQLADTYYSRVWGPDKPEKLPSKPARRLKTERRRPEMRHWSRRAALAVFPALSAPLAFAQAFPT